MHKCDFSVILLPERKLNNYFPNCLVLQKAQTESTTQLSNGPQSTHLAPGCYYAIKFNFDRLLVNKTNFKSRENRLYWLTQDKKDNFHFKCILLSFTHSSCLVQSLRCVGENTQSSHEGSHSGHTYTHTHIIFHHCYVWHLARPPACGRADNALTVEEIVRSQANKLRMS